MMRAGTLAAALVLGAATGAPAQEIGVSVARWELRDGGGAVSGLGPGHEALAVHAGLFGLRAEAFMAPDGFDAGLSGALLHVAPRFGVGPLFLGLAAGGGALRYRTDPGVRTTRRVASGRVGAGVRTGSLSLGVWYGLAIPVGGDDGGGLSSWPRMRGIELSWSFF